MIPAAEIAEAVARLDSWFSQVNRAAIAFSGGVDSGLVAYWARKCLGKQRSTAWIADSASLKRQDLAQAEEYCSRHDIELRRFETGELEDPNYAANPANRCYFCKGTLYQTLAKILPPASDLRVCSGANLDDQLDYRPSFKAAAEAHVRHPLIECGIGKSMVRALAREHGLELWDKPASPCLSSRIPYGQPVTREKLARIEAGESWLSQRGFPVCRVRHFEDRAVIEVPRDRLAALERILPEVTSGFRLLGFPDITIDPEGFVSGKLNRALVATTVGAIR